MPLCLRFRHPFSEAWLCFPRIFISAAEERTPCWKTLLPNSCVPGLNAWHHQSVIFINNLINICFKENNLGLFYSFNTQLLFCFCFVLATVTQIRKTWDQRFPKSCRRHNVCAGALLCSGIWGLCWKDAGVVFSKGHRPPSWATGIFTGANSEVLSWMQFIIKTETFLCTNVKSSVVCCLYSKGKARVCNGTHMQSRGIVCGLSGLFLSSCLGTSSGSVSVGSFLLLWIY